MKSEAPSDFVPPPPQPAAEKRKRRDPNEPDSTKTYTKGEFFAEYGEKKGLKVWQKAGQLAEREQQAAPKPATEKRRDPNDQDGLPCTCTRDEFIARYGRGKGLSDWNKAGQLAAQNNVPDVLHAVPKPAPEKRRDPNEHSTKTYTKAKFLDFYGEKKGLDTWNTASPEKRRDPNDPNSTKTYRKAEFIDYYGDEKGLRVWHKAGHLVGQAPPKPAAEKRREPLSKKMSTKAEFLAAHGTKKGLDSWNAASTTSDKKADC